MPKDKSTFGSRLRAARIKAGLSQKQLANVCGIPKPRLSRYENDHILPSVTSLARLADAIGVLPDSLLRPTQTSLDVFVDAVRISGIRFRDDDEARAVAHELSERYSRGAARQARRARGEAG